MSHIDDLIHELCPNGVEFKAVGEVTAKGSNIKWVNAGEAEFQYIDLSSVDLVTRRIGETVSITADNAPSRARQIVQTGDVLFATTRPAQMRWAVIPAEYDGQIASTGYCVLRPDTSVVLTNFLAHILGADTFRQYVEANQVAGNYPSIPDNRVRAYRIPVPPLEVQREIVRVLDQFTQLEAELEAELEARRRQYEHYRRTVLDKAFDGSSVRKLGEIADLNWGDTNTTKSSYIKNGGYIAFSAAGPDGMLDHFDYDRNAVVLSAIGALSGKTWRASGRWSCIKNTIRFFSRDESVVLTDYLYWVTSVAGFWPRRGSAQPFISKGDADQVLIPVPSIEEQRRVVRTLDKFDALVNDITSGLPAEIAARRKQYEYYRDKLLTFTEAA